MTEYTATTHGADAAPGDTPGAETFDVLIRHIEAAKRVYGSGEESARFDDEGALKAFPDVICTLLYAQPGTFCPLLYIHAPTVAERVPE